MTNTITEAEFLRFYDANPDLSGNGFKHRDITEEKHLLYRKFLKDSFDQIEKCIEYFQSEEFKNRKYKRSYMHSYGLKHKVERWYEDKKLACYVSNGSLIACAMILNWDIKRKRNSPNAYVRPHYRTLH